jgi:hypothetical protein
MRAAVKRGSISVEAAWRRKAQMPSASIALAVTVTVIQP